MLFLSGPPEPIPPGNRSRRPRHATREAEGDKFPHAAVALSARAISRKDRRVMFVISLLRIFDEVIIDWFLLLPCRGAQLSIARNEILSAPCKIKRRRAHSNRSRSSIGRTHDSLSPL